MVNPVGVRHLGLPIGWNGGTVGKGVLGASWARWCVCVQDDSLVRLKAPPDLAGQPLEPR